MIIVHIAPNAPFNEGWSYQENLLPKYQQKMGHDVTLITTNTMHQAGKKVTTDCCDIKLQNGVRLIRRPVSRPTKRFSLFPSGSFMDVYDLLIQIRPDYVFFHGLVSVTIRQVVKYKKTINPQCVIVQDNHQDFIIGMSTDGFRNKLIRFYYRRLVQSTIDSVSIVYGVTPWRKQYAIDYFGVPDSKTDVLLMGADDEEMDMVHRNEHRHNIRSSYGIKEDEFVIVSGGKIEDNKNIETLMEACGQLANVRLLLFGSVDKKIESIFYQLLESYSNIVYVGWIEAKDCYKYFYAADLVCFPGRHSVLWEQACASKVPCLIKHFPGMEHVNVGGNTLLIDCISTESLSDCIASLHFTNKYKKMLSIARSNLTDVFLYSEIAKKSLNDILKFINK